MIRGGEKIIIGGLTQFPSINRRIESQKHYCCCIWESDRRGEERKQTLVKECWTKAVFFLENLR